jgi:hypothetical protein
MVKRLIRTIRQKPKGTRDGVAFGLALVFSLFVFTVWIFNTPARMNAIEESYTVNKEVRESGFGSLFFGIKEQFATAINSVRIPTTTSETELVDVSQKSTSSTRTPSMQEVVDNIRKQNSPNEAGISTSSQEVEETGREVRIITTQSASSASSSRP